MYLDNLPIGDNLASVIESIDDAYTLEDFLEHGIELQQYNDLDASQKEDWCWAFGYLSGISQLTGMTNSEVWESWSRAFRS